MQQQSGSKRLKHSRYISGFDGIRTIAVIGVIVYHLLPYSLKGGYLGVPIFFVVSGYLITDLLLQEYEQNGSIDIWAFYGRRMKRLYPALVTMVLTTAAYITLFQRSLFVNLKSIIWTNLLYVYNWWEIGHGQSYFDRFNGESPFTHLWSLSIEGQFYLFWPLILIALLYVFHQRKTIFYLVIGVAVLSAIAMAVLYDPANTNRVYYGTDTRMFAILLGVGLAFMWPATKLKTELPDQARRALNITGAVSLILIVILFFKLSGETSFTYRGGMFIFTLLSTVLVATVAHPAGVMNQVLTNRLFDWVGKRSYGIYLYQFPIMIFYEARVTNIAAHPVLNALIETILILVVSDLSYRYLESPTRHYHYHELPQLVKNCFSRQSQYGWKRWVAIPAVMVTLIALYGAAAAPNHLPAKDNALQNHIQRNQKTVTKDNEAVLSKQKTAQKKAAKPKTAASKYAKVKLTSKQRSVAKDYDLTKTQLLTAKNMPVTAIGDSVMVDVSTDLRQVFPNTYVMAKVGRQVWQAPSEIHGLEAKGALSQNVLINLGTNGPMTTQQINDVIHAIGPKRHIFWVTTHVPTRNWETQTNTTIHEASKRFSNVTVIDWHGLSADHKSWFYNDNVHPNPTGNRYFTALVAKHMTD
ncbi:acyltransferase family protein [Secundilactobacillus paracollinoides]|uniref:Acyltransferase n=2 Tax=Secundilactobacillus paracollinoides TaxID=240427 RepID=A0A1B2J0B3_9LACO|nr:acyltransferase family protein [Secundilactobacillus paracollinoides]ANZ61832.1 acyltransferase [Secundilactobacillus paracollinoides]ANZ67751.1 acyltransferase [Secundilactobacillus paracollinoides]KRL75770.1 acyltransferase 3 [Secundilactobacillus paracollinoides DSM 15502 = JCM 11969]